MNPIRPAALLLLSLGTGGGHLGDAPSGAPAGSTRLVPLWLTPGGPRLPLPLSQSCGFLLTANTFGGVRSSNENKMAAAKMFRPEPFPMKGANFERVVKALVGHARSTYNVLHHFHSLSMPRRWQDKLLQQQKTSCYFITHPDHWSESGAVGEFVAAMQTVPVLAIHIVRRLNILKYFSISTYNGRVAIFGVRALEQVCQWTEKVDLLPPEVRGWLLDPDVVILTSGEGRTFQKKLHGIEVTCQLDTERIFAIYQAKGVIKPAVPAERGDLSWQMAYAAGYHAFPSHKNTWEQLVGDHKFKIKNRDWPEWRMPGWQPDSLKRLDEQELFHLYYGAYAPHMFVNRLLRHGLTYGGMDAVAADAPLRDCFLIFLQGSMEAEELLQTNPLGLHSDFKVDKRRDRSSPAVRLYNPQYEHLRTPLEKAEAKRARMAAFQEKDDSFLFPEPPSSTTSALRSDDGGEASLEEGELVEESVEILEEEELAEEPLQICVGEEDLSIIDDNNNNEVESPVDPPRCKKDNRLPKKSSRRVEVKDSGSNKSNAVAGVSSSSRSDADIREALQKMAGTQSSEPSTSSEVVRTVTVLDEPLLLPEPASRAPLAHRLGPTPSTSAAAAEEEKPCVEGPHPGYFTAQGWEAHKQEEEERRMRERVVQVLEADGDLQLRQEDLKGGEEGLLRDPRLPQQAAPQHLGTGGPERQRRPSARYAPFDLRSRLASQAADAESFRQEAKFCPPAQVAVMAPDRNLVLAARTARGPKPQKPPRARPSERKRNRNLSRRLLDHPPMTKEQVINNPFAAAPVFDKRCSFCASWHCSRYLRGTRTLNCACFKEQLELAPTRRLCDYRRCGAGAVDHHTAVCPTLHARCTTCGCRGHTAAHACSPADERVMERFRFDFEEVADTGIYTQKRFKNLAWGFYPYPASAPRNVVVVSYRRLSDLPVLAAIGLLESVLQLPENRALPQGGILESGHRLTAVHPRDRPSSPSIAYGWGEENEDVDSEESDY